MVVMNERLDALSAKSGRPLASETSEAQMELSPGDSEAELLAPGWRRLGTKSGWRTTPIGVFAINE